MAGAVALWPNLFGAAVIGAPLADFAIVRHGDGSIGAGMGSEFGDWNDPAQRRSRDMAMQMSFLIDTLMKH